MMAINVDAFRSMCGVFKRDACIKAQHTLYVIPRRETSLRLLTYFLLQFAYRWGKRWPFFVFFLFSFFFTRWGKPLIWKSPTNVRSNKRKKKRHHGFDPASVEPKYYNLFPLYCARPQTHVHILKTTLDLWDYKIKVWKKNTLWFVSFQVVPVLSRFPQRLNLLRRDELYKFSLIVFFTYFLYHWYNFCNVRKADWNLSFPSRMYRRPFESLKLGKLLEVFEKGRKVLCLFFNHL